MTAGPAVRRALTGATVIDGTGRAPIPEAVVVIEDGRIRSVGPAATVVVPDDAEVIDATGGYVIPGLLDANVHLVAGLTPQVLLPYEDRYTELAVEAAQLTLRSGVTTVFDTWGPLDPLVAARDSIARGDVPGSRMYVAGNIIGFGGPLSGDFLPVDGSQAREAARRIDTQFEQGVGRDLLWLSPDGVRTRVRDYIERTGIDFVKYAASGHGAAFTPFIAFSAPAQRAIVEEAHRAGLTVQAHSTTVESLRMEVEAGADLLQHGEWTGPEPIPDETLAAIVDGRVPVAAIVSTERHLAWVREHGNERYRDLVFNKTRDENIRRLIAAGARLLLTTDGFVPATALLDDPSVSFLFSCDDSPNTLGDSHFVWLEAVIERGMPPMEALLSATRYVAEAYGQSDDVGTLEPGKRADLLVLDADPLEDVRNYRRISAVLKDGATVDRDALPTGRLLLGETRQSA